MISKEDVKRIFLTHHPHDNEPDAPFSYQIVAEDDVGKLNVEGKGAIQSSAPFSTRLCAPCVYCSKYIDVTDKLPEIIEQFNEMLDVAPEIDVSRKIFAVCCENDHTFELGIELQI